MARQVISQKEVLEMQSLDRDSGAQPSTPPAVEADAYVDRLLKYIPAEIVAVFILVKGLILKLQTTSESFEPIYWGVFLLFVILTPLYLWRLQKVSKATQLIISSIAFVVWVFALGGPFTTLGWYNPLYGEILLPIFTIIIAIVVAEK